MAEYKVQVTTEDRLFAGTSDYVYLTLIGTEGESERTLLNNWGAELTRGTTGSYTVKTPTGTVSLGELLLLRLEMDPLWLLPEDQWFCSTLVVRSPQDPVGVLFPCHKWVSRGQQVELRGGPARKVFEDVNPLLLEHRTKELEQRRQVYQFVQFAGNLPRCSGFKEMSEVPNDISLSTSKIIELMTTQVLSQAEIKLKGLSNSTQSWKNLEDLKSVFWRRTSPVYEYCVEHWKDDAFYGSQFLNGVNINIIQRCSQLPPDFAVTEEMVAPVLQQDTCLHTEMKNGNIFICDYKVLRGMPSRVVNGETLKVADGFCLLYNNPQGELRPIAIQLQQQPSDKNPVFLPGDSKTDWLLAKMFIKNADNVLIHNIRHILNVHFLAEGFALATLRNLPLIHPLYKLLIPHFRFTIQVNIRPRQDLQNEDGFLNLSPIGILGSMKLMARVHVETTYESLCLPEDIAARGLQTIPNFYYREDGQKLWDIIYSFVKELVGSYYPSNEDVTRDSELQAWIGEIFTNVFLEKASSGVPQEFHNVEDLTKFITMVIFRTSGQHAAIHQGQFDYLAWTPNNPMVLRKPLPSAKGQSSMETLLETLPDKGTTARIMSSVIVISHQVEDMVPLGQYPSEHFGEAASKQMIKAFQGALACLSEEIDKRNSELALPYLYLNPAQIENSVAQ